MPKQNIHHKESLQRKDNVIKPTLEFKAPSYKQEIQLQFLKAPMFKSYYFINSELFTEPWLYLLHCGEYWTLKGFVII